MSAKEILREKNKSLLEVLKKYNVKTLRMTSIGNSIATGYSMARETKPLLLRNEELKEILENDNLFLEVYSFARPQNNNDENVFEWILNNISESEMNKIVRSDLGVTNRTVFKSENEYISSASNKNETTSMKVLGVTKKRLEEYYPLKKEIKKNIQDVILESEENLANIIVYNGATGSFLDGFTRDKNRNLLYQIFNAMPNVKRDITSIEAILKFIQEKNRMEDKNTQIYLCGAPDFLGLKISSYINNKLKKIASHYANVIYVKPVKSKFFYKEVKEKDTDTSKIKPDIHYSEEEYLKLNTNIINEIASNYPIVKAMINIDRSLLLFSRKIELTSQSLAKDSEFITTMVNSLINKEAAGLKSKNERKKLFLNLEKYLLYRSPYDFYYLFNEEKSIKYINTL